MPSTRRRPPLPIVPALLAALAACAFPRAVPPRASAEVARGYEQLSAGDAERAEIAFEHALAFDPDLPEAENGLALVARTRGDLGAARRHLERAVRLRPGFAEGHANLGELLLALERPREAEDALRAALRIDPDLAEARQNLARALLLRGVGAAGDERASLLGRARREYLHLLEAEPERPAAFHDLALIDYLQARYDRAEAGYRRAAELEPSRESLHGLCVSLVRLGRCDEAARACERCLALDPAADRCTRSLAGALACR
jgi:Tfp pilus assembly protein PilF